MLLNNNTSFLSADSAIENCGPVVDTQWGRFGATLANFVVMLLGLVGNSLILVVVISSKHMKNTTDIFIANMAFSDLVFPLLVIPRKITEIYFGERRWLIGGTVGLALCKTLYFLQDLSTAVSIFSLILITVDRLYAIVLPLKRFLVTKRCSLLIASLTWCLGFAVHGIYFEEFTLVPDNENRLYCYLRWDIKGITLKTYYMFSFICFALAPFILMTIVYSIIFVRLRRQQRRIGISLSDPQNTQRSLRQRKILYLSFAIVVSFAIAWAPFNIAAFLQLFIYYDSYGNSCDWNTLLFIGMFLAHANSAANPIITFLFSSKFRMASREIVSRIGRQYVQRSNQVTNVTNMEMQ